jgi:hypothetical protein
VIIQGDRQGDQTAEERAMSSSTSSAPRGWRLEDIPNDELASLLQISRKEVAARRAALAQQQTDPAWVAATLDGLPAASLALLHVLIEAGGLALEHELFRAARERFGMSESDCRAATEPAMSRILMVPLRTQGAEPAIGIVLPAGSLVAPLVANLDLYELPDAAFVTSESPDRNARMFLATCVATRHLDVRLTHGGRPHRGSIKRLARQVGLDEASLEVLLGTGLDLGMVNLEGDLLRPDVETLADAAIGRYPGFAALAASHAQLAGGPVASATLLRSLQRRLNLACVSFIDSDTLMYLPGFEVGTVAGVVAVARRAIEGEASGHITPSFEVVLPPESRLLDIVHVGACCEWERLDRALDRTLDRTLVARITKASIARAVTGGASADQILEQLAAASRPPIPQNVEAAIRAWAGATISATLATGHVIAVAPSAHARVSPALAALDARTLAPGVFVISERQDKRDITLALTRAGLYHRELSPVRPPPPRAFEPEPCPPALGAARIRARVAAWRRGEPFEGLRDDFLDQHRAAQPDPPATSTPGPPSELLERWAIRRGCRFEDDAIHDGIVATLSMLPACEAASILRGCHGVDQLLRRLGKAMDKRRWGRPPSTGSRRSPPGLRWQREELRERLEQAARHSEALALQLASGVRYIEVTHTMRRGTIWMVFGDDIASDDAVALRLHDIQAIAPLPDDFDVELDTDIAVNDDGPFDRKPWRPAHGQAAPPGHLPCPCGSGMRYRRCCRDLATA